MRLTLIAVGKRMPDWVNLGYQEYAKRLPTECRLQLIEIPNEKRTPSSNLEKVAEIESQKILDAIPPHNHVVAFERVGKLIDTVQFSQHLQDWSDVGRSVTFIIGGPEGLAKSCLERAHELWSLSKLTFPHPLVRLIVIEQIYRSWSIIKHHPYHR